MGDLGVAYSYAGDFQKLICNKIENADYKMHSLSCYFIITSSIFKLYKELLMFFLWLNMALLYGLHILAAQLNILKVYKELHVD